MSTRIASDWPVGLSTGCFYRTSILDCLEPIQRAGFSIIEICSFPAHLDYHNTQAVRVAADRIAGLGLEPYSLHAPFADHIDITAPDRAVREASLVEIQKAADAAALMGVRFLVIHPGPERGGFPVRERYQRMENAAEMLNRAASHCRRIGVGIVLENMLPHLFSGHIRELMWILGALETTNVGVCLDTGDAHLSGDLRTVAHKLSGHLWMLHASDNHGQYDDHLAPGDGKIAWPALLEQLSQTDFNGAMILEIAGQGTPETILDSARRGRAFLRALSHRLALGTPVQ